VLLAVAILKLCYERVSVVNEPAHIGECLAGPEARRVLRVEVLAWVASLSAWTVRLG